MFKATILKVTMLTVLGFFIFQSASFGQDSASTEPIPKKSTLTEAIANTVRADFILAWDGDEMAIARSDVEAHKVFGNRIEIFARINFLPWVARESIAARLKKNEDINKSVARAIAQGLKNQIAAQLGVPANLVVVPQPVLQAVLAANLESAVDQFVESKLTTSAQNNAGLREIGFALTLVGVAPEANNQIILEVGKLDPMYAQDMGYRENPTQAHMHFRFSRPAVRVKYANHNVGIVTYMEVGNDAGLWEIANPQANASFEYISTIIAKSRERFFDLSDVNSWEVGLIKYIGPKQSIILAFGKRPVLELEGRSEYVLGKYNAELGQFLIEAQGGFEQINDTVVGESLVKRFEVGVSREVKGYNLGVRSYNRRDTLVKEDFTTVLAGFNKGLKSFSAFTLGIGARAYVYKYSGKDLFDQNYKWQKGFDVGAGITFGKKPVEPADVLFEQNKKLNESRKKDRN